MKGIVYTNYLIYQYNIEIYSFIEEKEVRKEIVRANNYLNTAGISLFAVACHLSVVKRKLYSERGGKPRGWNAYLDSGILHCSIRFAQDFIGAHESWLVEYDGDEYLLAGLPSRSRSAMRADGVTDKDRE